MEAATKSTTRAGSSHSLSSDRELALRLGSLMLCTMHSDGGAVIRAIDESGLTFSQMKTLVALASTPEEPMTVKSVSERVGLSLASASRTVDELVKRSLVSRVEDPDDRRVRRISLTAEGQEIADVLMEARVAGLENFVSTLSAVERRKLDAALEVLLRREDIAKTYEQHKERATR
jgi:DNA-binding MarR family transcriptional regulator